jgi:protease I
MNVLMVIAPQGFRDEELTAPRQELELAGYHVTLASLRVGECKGVYGTSATAELTLSEVDTRRFDGVVFVGGPGARSLFGDWNAHRIAREMARAHKVTAAICIAPVILARAGVLRGHRATVYESEVPELVAGHAVVRALGIVSDPPIVTANGPDQARRFAAVVVQALDQQLATQVTQQLDAAHSQLH